MNQELITTVMKHTKKNEGSHVNEISKELAKSRNYVAREMNILVEEGILFCIEEKEPIYYHKRVFELENKCIVKKNRYLSMNELMKQEKKTDKLDFEKLIGYQDSLASCVQQCKAAISYPNDSLPTLLYGPTGTGKSFIAQLMYEYAVNHHILDEEKPFITVNCSEYANNPELLTANLFGHKKGAFTGADKDNPGLIQVADGGVLFLDEVHCLKAECQEKLFLFMDKGIYHRVGENEKWERAHVRLIFATTEKPQEVLLKTFLRRVPIIVTIPSLKERGIYERIQLIYSSFMQESEKINKEILISNFVYNMFVHYEFEGNIGELKNTIRVCCANAFSDSKDENIEIHMKHLPSNMFAKQTLKKNVAYQGDHRMMDMRKLYIESNNHSQVIVLYNKLMDAVYKNRNQLIEECFKILTEYYNHVMYDSKDIKDYKSSYIMNEISEIFKEVFERYNININNNDLVLLFKYIGDVMEEPLRIHDWQEENHLQIIHLKKEVSSILNRELLIAEEIAKHIHQHLDLVAGDMFTFVLAVNIKMMNRDRYIKRRVGIILAHGYSTASSIANAANQLLNQHMFEAIDMPIEVTTAEIIDSLNSYLTKMNHYEEVILLVDMGSLEEIY